ncbi:hypothetical protein GIY30_23020 [Gordonia sp. HNM0687]|uniref:Oxidoreductase n=1 Tax=Gordonia mangrovi TaxID=2665643 RepID=A0A6L7GZ48_9ACTN|nr:hypothetical protein [Gordonia mangrovi]
MANPDEIANVVTFLASDEASFVTGVVLPVVTEAGVVSLRGRSHDLDGRETSTRISQSRPCIDSLLVEYISQLTTT